MNGVVLAWLALCMIWGSGWLFIKLGLRDLPPFTFAGILLEGNPLHLQWTPLALASLLYLVLIGSCVAFILEFWLLQRMPDTRALLLRLITPLVAVTFGKLINGEEFTWRILVGGACILSGVGTTIFQQKRLCLKNRRQRADGAADDFRRRSGVVED